MYYEEKIENGVLWIKTTPQGLWRIAPESNTTRLIKALCEVDLDTRLAVFMRFCKCCSRELVHTTDYCDCQYK